MKKIRMVLFTAVILAAVLLPVIALAAPAGAYAMLYANGESMTVADPSTDVSNTAASPTDRSKPMWRHDEVLQNTVNQAGGSDALVYWQIGTQYGQPVYSYIYMSSADTLYGGGRVDFTGSSNITQTGGKLSSIVGGSFMSNHTGSSSITVSGGECENVLGGSYNGNFDGDVAISITGGEVGNTVGGCMAYADSSAPRVAIVFGKVSISAGGGTIGRIFGGGVAQTKDYSDADAYTSVAVSTEILLQGNVRIKQLVASGGYAASESDYIANSEIEGDCSLTIRLPDGKPGQYVLNDNPDYPIALLGGGVSRNFGDGSSSTLMGHGEVNIESGTIYGLVAGGGLAIRENNTGGADTRTISTAVRQTGGYVPSFGASNYGGYVSGGGVTVLPMSGSDPDVSQAASVSELTINPSVRVSGGMTRFVSQNGIVMGYEQGGYKDPKYVRVYSATPSGETVITGGSVWSGLSGTYAASSEGVYHIYDTAVIRSRPTLGNGTPVYCNAILLHDACGSSLAACTPLKNQPVTALRGDGASYGMNDVYTDDTTAASLAGGVFAWLPQGSRTTGAVSGSGIVYPYLADHPGKDADYSDTTANTDMTWMVLKADDTPAPTEPPAPKPPKTGDSGMPFVWAGLVMLSVVGLGVCARALWRRKREE